MPGEWDLDQPIELRIRGWFIDIIGMIAALEWYINDLDGEWEGLDRAEKVATDLLDDANEQVNLGYIEREMKKAARDPEGHEGLEYGGIQTLISKFDPRHPEASAPDIDRLTPLDEAEFYAILLRSEDGFEAAGWPEQLGVEESMMLASFLRSYARDLEEGLPDEGDLEDPG